MDPLTIAGLAIGLLQALILAFARLGPAIWKTPLEEIVPHTLRVRLEKSLFDARAAEKFLLEVPASPFDEDPEREPDPLRDSGVFEAEPEDG